MDTSFTEKELILAISAMTKCPRCLSWLSNWEKKVANLNNGTARDRRQQQSRE